MALSGLSLCALRLGQMVRPDKLTASVLWGQNMKVWILVMILHDVAGVPETPVFIGAFSTADVCEKNLHVHVRKTPAVQLRCSEQRVLDW
jgi:hypothetical protein